MENLNIKQIVKELKKHSASKAEIELISNNVNQYNDLVSNYNEGNTKNAYLMYQLNLAITKQINDLKKVNSKISTEVNNNIPLADSINKKIEYRSIYPSLEQ